MASERDRHKKLRERKHLDRFRESMHGYPEGEIEPSDPLDFIVHSQTGKIGIEHTEYLQVDKRGFPVMKETESLRKRVRSLVKKKYEEQERPPLCIGISWKPGTGLRKNRIFDLANEIFALVLSNLPSQNDDSIGLDRNHGIPEELLGLTIIRSSKFNSTSVCMSDAGSKAIFGTSDMRRIIASKEKKIPLYKHKKCSEVWLLIVADGAELSSTAKPDHEVLTYEFSSEFDRVFYFDALNSWALQLKTKLACRK